MTIGRPSTPLEKRLENYIVDSNGCWLWQGSINKGGYGVVRYNKKSTTAHRAYWLRYIDSNLNPDLYLDHLCRVRRCINPAHLEPVTPKENTLRGVSPSATVVKTNVCKRGHILTPENVYLHYGKQGKLRVCRLCRQEREEKQLINAICQYCGNTFKLNRYRLNRGKFCSTKCSSNNRWHAKAS